MPRQQKRGCPAPVPVPKLVTKGGIEVLELRTGPDSITTIETYLQPRMGSPTQPSFSEAVTVGSASSDKPPKPQLPCYSAARVPLPVLNEDLTCNSILMWEAISVKTEVVGISSMVNCHSATKRMYDNAGIGLPVEGLNFHMFAVGGEPLELQALVQNGKTTYPGGVVAPQPLDDSATALNPKLKTRLLLDGAYPVEVWSPDPSRNENTRYFGSYTGGQQTPPVLQFSNTVTTVLLDENGIGPLCKGEGLFLTAADICGFVVQSDGKMYYRGLPRYFNVTLRKRRVKNPYPVTSLLSSLFTNLAPRLEDGQPMTGDNSQVEEVRIYQGTEPLPGDPSIDRFVDKYGEERTRLPSTS
ncbi:putative VP1 [Gammapolyomavirus phacarbo]|uniref:Capsid protein VP1 n=1 Tax=cormorant polyomavirus 1 TaxID=2896467 RepID=A0A8K1VS46_9POLY|nr:putative VP1 [cormorant polyomavirus 1]